MYEDEHPHACCCVWQSAPLSLLRGFTVCWSPESVMHAGLAPEKIHFLDEGGFKVESGDVSNVLRPETVESIYYMWRLTGEQRYREWGWEIFQAFQEHARGDVGYHSLKVTSLSGSDP